MESYQFRNLNCRTLKNLKLKMKNEKLEKLRKGTATFSGGFTLVEVFISTAILSIITMFILQVMNVGDASWHADMGLVQLQQQTRGAMHGMIREIRQSNSATISEAGKKIAFSFPDGAGGYTLSISYELSGDQIIRTHAGSTRALASDVDDLSFCCGSTCNTNCTTTEVVEVQINAGKTIRQRPKLLFNLTEKVRLRNE